MSCFGKKVILWLRAWLSFGMPTVPKGDERVTASSDLITDFIELFKPSTLDSGKGMVAQRGPESYRELFCCAALGRGLEGQLLMPLY